ncbi:hypothetical protein J5N97_006788 [Dioscorea zingiberensis]|uniref:B box-type domain-containing protein n=1 Tax=Dioscorea zingiberensis TaxID=325984 RepID=A0A9D5DDY9_9LILI|nr:hypothetical protein J5N97_006788 [Dioscorea zingiberensis]
MKAGFALHFKKRRDRKSHEWLGLLLKKKFFGVCKDHSDLRKSEMNIYCINCDRCMCPHCLVSPAIGCHRFHRILQIRRYVYQDVIRIHDMQSLLDCSKVQPYTVNSAKVVLLKPRKQSKPSNGTTAVACEMCGRAIADPNRYCSIACKVSEGPTSSTPSTSSISSLGNDHEAGDCLSLQRRPSDSIDVALRSKMNGNSIVINILVSSFVMISILKTIAEFGSFALPSICSLKLISCSSGVAEGSEPKLFFNMCNLHHQILLFLFICLYPMSLGFSWPFSSSASSTPPPNFGARSNALNTEFSMDDINNDPRAMKLLENAKERLLSSNTCWQSAYQSLFAGCSEIIVDKEKQSRLAWLLSDCFQKDSGRPTLPSCDPGTQMVKCLKKLNDAEHKVYLEFFLETNSICHQLQASTFKHDTERLVNGLAKSARFAEIQLGAIMDKSEKLLQGSTEIHDSLTSIDIRTERMAQTSREIDSKIHDVLKHSEAIFEQSRGISASQVELQQRQTELKENLESGMTFVRESYESLGVGIEKVRIQTIEIEKEIMEVGDSMSSKMRDLQSTANDIGNVAGVSLDRQRQLLDGQVAALKGLDFLTQFQSQALQESRDALQKLAEFGEKQQAELLQKQEQIQHAHDRLIQNSQSILAAQEEFETKQANVFAALEKLFTLHNTLLAESRFIKSFFFYSCVIFLLYMLTSTKQTFSIRARLYIGLCITFMLELAIIRLGDGDLLQQTWITSQVFVARSSFLAVASIQLIYAIFTYRDYEILNHQLLQKLIDKVNIMERNSGKKLLSLSIESDSYSSNLSQYSWIDKELLEDADSKIDPNYILPEEVCENSITTDSITRKYNLRPRRRDAKFYP